MNRIKSLIFLVAATILQAAPSLKAQQEVFNAKVPFQFSAGDRTLPSGEYRITRRNAFLTIENRREFSSALILTSSADSSRDSESRLIFDHVDDLYFLRGVVAPVGGIELAVSRTEKKATMDQRRLSKVSLPVTSTALRSGGQ
jgi:hypothetical protein